MTTTFRGGKAPLADGEFRRYRPKPHDHHGPMTEAQSAHEALLDLIFNTAFAAPPPPLTTPRLVGDVMVHVLVVEDGKLWIPLRHPQISEETGAPAVARIPVRHSVLVDFLAKGWRLYDPPRLDAVFGSDA